MNSLENENNIENLGIYELVALMDADNGQSIREKLREFFYRP